MWLIKRRTSIFVRKCANVVYDTLSKLSHENKLALFSLLHHTKITVVCEFLQRDYQHIVNLGNTDKLVFLTFTFTYNADNFRLTAFPPHITLKLLNLLHVTSPHYTIINNYDKKDIYYIQDMKNEINTEGRVFLFLE